jgi:CRP/FNR family transcriptional regulator, cyclic AMP receptor protein
VSPLSGTLCYVLREDPELAEHVPPPRRAKAVEECVARELRILELGSWTGASGPSPDNGIGLLVLEGLMLRRVGIEGRFGAELLGEGDLLRPWQRAPDFSTPLPLTTSWSIIEPTRLAVLEDDFLQYIARYPELAGGLLARALERSRQLAMNMAIVHHARVEVRLHMLFWHLAARWGRVRSDATVLPLHLTHTLLADLVAARRPTVTSALSELARRGSVRFDGEVWVLTGGPPGELLDLAPVPYSATDPPLRSVPGEDR